MIRKITSLRNWIGKTFLWLLGILIIMSYWYPHILKGFLLTERELPEIGWDAFTPNGIGLIFILGGWHLNKLADKFLGNANTNGRNND